MDDREMSIESQEISDVVQTAITEYSKATSPRAIPDENDSFKESQRRLLYGMWLEGCIYPWKRYVKTSAVIGETLPLHPHGDAALYGALIKMGQDFIIPYPLVNIGGNKGTHSDPNSYASMRYTECKASEFGYDVVFQDFHEKLVDFKVAEDYAMNEPIALSTRIPLILVEGVTGIGEAFTSSIPPHNLNDIVNLCIKYIQTDGNISNAELTKGLFPDYPCGGVIVNGAELEKFYATQELPPDQQYNCTVKLEGKIEIDYAKDNDKYHRIRIKEFPVFVYYRKVREELLNLAANNTHLNNLVNMIDVKSDTYQSLFEGHLYFRKDTNLAEIEKILFENTSLSSSQTLSFRVYQDGKVKKFSVKQIIANWYKYRSTYIGKEIYNKKNTLEVETTILAGLCIVYDEIDNIIQIIKKSADKNAAMEAIWKKYPQLALIQVKAIVEMSLYKISRASKQELLDKIESNKRKIADLEVQAMNIPNTIIKQLLELSKKYGRPRRTKVLMEKKAATIDISQSVLTYARNSYVIHDINTYINDNLKILNGLTSIKINGTTYKELIDFDYIDKGCEGLVIFLSDNTYQYISKDKILRKDNWINFEFSKPDLYITKIIPFYSENDYVIVLSKDMKLKRVMMHEFTSKGTVPEFSAMKLIRDGFDGHISIFDENGNYLYIEEYISNTEEIPTSSKKSIGVNTKFDPDTKIFIVPIADNTLGSLMLFYFDQNENIGYMNRVSVETLELGSRTNKLKNINPPKMSQNIKLCGVGLLTASHIDPKNSNQTLMFITKNSVNKINPRNIRNYNEFKTISSKNIGLLHFIFD